jgi:hypothetical protein
MGIGRKKLIPNSIGIGGGTESLGNEGESAGVNGACTGEYGGYASLRQFVELRHSFVQTNFSNMQLSQEKTVFKEINFNYLPPELAIG